jgi:hypothetical protein
MGSASYCPVLEFFLSTNHFSMSQVIWSDFMEPPWFIPVYRIIHSCKWPTWRTILFSICLFHFSTCFEQPRAHHKENKLYRYSIWYVSFCVGDRLVCRLGRKFLPDLHTTRSPTQSDTYQIYRYNWFSWWLARGCSKHVENWNKHIEKRIVHQFGHLQELYWDARSTQHKEQSVTGFSPQSAKIQLLCTLFI